MDWIAAILASGPARKTLGLILAALIIAHRSQSHIAWFSLLPLIGFLVLTRVGVWYRDHLAHQQRL